MHSIPKINLAAFSAKGDQRERDVTARELADSISLHGCVAVTGHGLPADTLEEVFTFVEKFFQLPLEDKMKAPHPENFDQHRGYSAPGRENASGKTKTQTEDTSETQKSENVVDRKETFDVGNEQNHEEDNIWPPHDLLPGFQSFMVKFFWQLSEVAQNVLEALMAALQLSPEECEVLRRLHSTYYHAFRLAHYLPVSLDQVTTEDLCRMAAHTDYCSFTMLFQREHGGLEFENRVTGEWMPATPMPGYFYLNVADLFERISNGRFPSAKHRVVVPTSGIDHQTSIPSRYSIPFAIIPKGDGGIVAPQPSLVARDGKQKFEPLSCDDYFRQMIEATYAK